jgi:hypothetical protein
MDASMFDHKSTLIPHWVIDNVFDIRETFPLSSRKDPRTIVEIEYRNPDGEASHHRGWVVTTHYEKGRNDVMRLFLDEGVIENLKRDFQMTYLRSVERRHRDWNSPTAEREISFWEFLDMEFDAEETVFVFVPHYNLEPYGLERFTHLDEGA